VKIPSRRIDLIQQRPFFFHAGKAVVPIVSLSDTAICIKIAADHLFDVIPPEGARLFDYKSKTQYARHRVSADPEDHKRHVAYSLTILTMASLFLLPSRSLSPNH